MPSGFDFGLGQARLRSSEKLLESHLAFTDRALVPDKNTLRRYGEVSAQAEHGICRLAVCTKHDEIRIFECHNIACGTAGKL
jgi:hypothetical protein